MKNRLKNFIYNKLLILVENYNFSLEKNCLYSFIISIIISVLILITLPELMNIYCNYNYITYLLAIITAIILILPLIYLVVLPIALLANLLYIYYLNYRAVIIDKEKKEELIFTAIKNLEGNIISAEKLSDLILLPTEILIKDLNLYVFNGKAEIHISDTGNIYYNFNSTPDNLISNLIERTIDAN